MWAVLFAGNEAADARGIGWLVEVVCFQEAVALTLPEDRAEGVADGTFGVVGLKVIVDGLLEVAILVTRNGGPVRAGCG